MWCLRVHVFVYPRRRIGVYFCICPGSSVNVGAFKLSCVFVCPRRRIGVCVFIFHVLHSALCFYLSTSIYLQQFAQVGALGFMFSFVHFGALEFLFLCVQVGALECMFFICPCGTCGIMFLSALFVHDDLCLIC